MTKRDEAARAGLMDRKWMGLATIESVDQALIAFEKAELALADALEYQQVRHVRTVAIAVEACAREAADHRLLDLAQELKINAERKAGEMLRHAAETGDRATKDGNVNPKTKVSSPTTPTLAAIGITRDQSSRWQQLSRHSDECFRAAKDTLRGTGKMTSNAVVRAMREADPPSAPPKLSKIEKLARAERAARRAERKREKELAQIDHAAQFMIYARLALRELRTHDGTYTTDQTEMLQELEEEVSKRLLHERQVLLKEEIAKGVLEERERLNRATAEAIEERRSLNRAMEGLSGFMTIEEFRLVRSCLHPDRMNSIDEARLREAFQIFERCGDVCDPSKRTKWERSYRRWNSDA